MGTLQLGCAQPAADAKATAPGHDGGQPTPVVTDLVRQGDAPVYLSGLGGVEAFYTATVKSQVDGPIERVLFREGQQVQRGALLVQIDPRPFEIAVRTAEANLARDEATLKNNQLNLQRNAALLDKSLVAQQTVTDLQATVDQLAATVQADRAAVDNAKLQLTYSRVTAPISGRTGLRLADPGNLVHANDANGLVVITQLDPIAVVFTLPEDDLPQVAAGMAHGTLRAKAISRDGKKELGTGEVMLVDNQIDPGTGTMRLKAIFPNPAQTLWPKQFVRVQLHVDTLRDAICVPSAAVQHGPHGDFVYTVDAQHMARMAPVQVLRLQGEQALLAPGLAAGAQVVVDGQYRLHEGATVAPTLVGIATPGDEAAPPEGGPVAAPSAGASTGHGAAAKPQ
jgi:multidrug efflux system membrane fusion protein